MNLHKKESNSKQRIGKQLSMEKMKISIKYSILLLLIILSLILSTEVRNLERQKGILQSLIRIFQVHH